MTSLASAPSATVPADPAPASATRSPQRAGAVLVFALLLVALAARTVFLIWEGPFDGSLHYDHIAALGATYWTMNIAVGGPAFGVSWIALAILVALLARGRSAPATLASAALIGIGGLVFALVVTAETLPFAYAADPEVVPEAEGRALFDALNAHLAMLMPTILGSQIVVAAGVLIALVVSLVSRALPRWFAIAGLVYLLAYFAIPFELLPHAAVVATDVLQSLLVAGIGWFGMRVALGRAGRARVGRAA